MNNFVIGIGRGRGIPRRISLLPVGQETVTNTIIVPGIIGRGRSASQFSRDRPPGKPNTTYYDYLKALREYREEKSKKMSQDQLLELKTDGPQKEIENDKENVVNLDGDKTKINEENPIKIKEEKISETPGLETEHFGLSPRNNDEFTKGFHNCGLPSTSVESERAILRNLDGERINDAPAAENSKEPDYKFSVIKLIGNGAFGRVFKVRDKLGNDFAMKVMDEATGNKKQISKEIQTLELLRQLNCQDFSCIQMIMSYRWRTITYLQFPLCGPTLRKMIRIKNSFGQIIARGFQMRQIKEILMQLVSALNFLHAHQIIHLDIKLDNIIFTQGDWLPVDDDTFNDYKIVKMVNTEIRLIDFGLSVVNPEKKLLDTKVCCLIYRPPESILKTKISYPVDIWCLGLSGVAMYLGRELFRGSSTLELLAQMEIVLGPFSPKLLALKRAQSYFRNNMTKRTTLFRDEAIEHCHPLKELKKLQIYALPETDKFFDLLEHMLKLDSAERPTSADLLEMMKLL